MDSIMFTNSHDDQLCRACIEESYCRLKQVIADLSSVCDNNISFYCRWFMNLIDMLTTDMARHSIPCTVSVT